MPMDMQEKMTFSGDFDADRDGLGSLLGKKENYDIIYHFKLFVVGLVNRYNTVWDTSTQIICENNGDDTQYGTN